MSWITTIWSMLMGACIALALPHLFMGFRTRQGPHLFLVLAALAVIAISAGELLLMRTMDVGTFAGVLRWMQLPIFFLTVGLVGFVHSYLGGSRLWLGVTACVIRFLCVLINFAVQPNLNFDALTGLRQIRFLGENVSVPIGTISPWTHLSELASVLVLIFVVDAAGRAWPKSTAERRQLLLLVCGSIALFIFVATLLTGLTHRQVVAIPYMVSFPFAAIVIAIAFELGTDLFRASRIVQELEVSEASLHESEARFARMADAAPVMIWMSGTDKLCTFFNKAWLEFTGREMSQELGHGWAEGVHSDDFEKCLRTYSGAFDQRLPFVMQYRLRDRNGGYRCVTDNGVPRYGRQGNFRGYIGACVDITDLLEKNRALRQVEERVTLAAEVAHLGIWELEPENGHLWMSDKGRKLFGFEPEATINYESLLHQVHPEDRSRWQGIVSRAIKTQGSYEVEYRILMPDGTTRWIGGRGQCVPVEGGEVTRLVGVSMDVTERKQAQRLFELAAEASPSGIVLVDPKGQIVLTNAHVEELFGYGREELVGKPLETLVPERFATQDPFDRNQFLALAQTRPFRAGGDLCGLRKDGMEFPIEIGLSPVETPQGVLVLASIVDLSARKLAEEEAQRRRDEIELLSRLSLLGEMTASIAHEVNQPLSGIISNASAGQRFIDRGDLDRERLRAILADIVVDGRRAHDIIRNIRNTVKKGGTIREPLDLNEVVRNVAHLMEPEADSHSCELETSLVSDLPKVEGDPVQIQQVLVNLIGNAFDAMSDTPPAQRKVEVSVRPNGGGTICVSVRDYGIGIREEMRDQLFQQFFTTKEDGLGMGLAIVRSIVEAHEGMIAVENAEGGGARFYFTLPIREKSNI